MQNFRGAQDVRISLAEGCTTIAGDNGTGKSTVRDAFLWLLFGKDAEGRKDFNVKRIEAGEPLRRTDVCVEGTFTIDGREHRLRRTYSETWRKKRGATEETYEGNETTYTIDDVPRRMSEYDRWVSDEMAPADVFRMITDPAFFPRMDWKKQREMLFELAGPMDEAALAAGVEGYTDLLSRLSSKSTDDYRRELAARKTKLNKQLREISPRTDQTRLMIPTALARDVLERKLTDADARLEALNREAADFAARERAQGEEARRRVESAEELKTRMARRTAELKRKAEAEAERQNEGHRRLEERIRDAEASVRAATRTFREAQAEVDALSQRIQQKEAECERLRAAWHTEHERPYTGDGVCPHCLQPLPEDAQRDNRRRFEEAKNERLSQIQAEGHRMKAEIAELNEEMQAAEARFNKACGDLHSEEVSAEILRDELAALPEQATPAAVDPMADEEYKALADELAALEGEDACRGVSHTPGDEDTTAAAPSITDRLADLNKERDAIRRGLSDCDTADRLRAEIQRLEEEGRTLAQQIADAERDEDTLRRYTRARIEAVERGVNGLFHNIRFQLYDYTIDGGEVEVCRPLVGAELVPFEVANTALQVWAGLDIIRVLQAHAGVSAPVFVDGAEGVTRFPRMDHQAILLRVEAGVRPMRVSG